MQRSQIIRFKELQRMLGSISRSSLDRWERAGLFPRRISLGKNSIGWNLSAIEAWLDDRQKRSATSG